jgi:hypothetical protein
MNSVITGALFVGVSRTYTSFVSESPPPLRTQLVVGGLLSASSYVAGLTTDTPANKAIATGALFGGVLYTLGTERLLVPVAVGTLLTYLTEIAREETKVREETNGD